MADVDRIAVLAADLLDAIEDAAATHAVTLPDRRFIAEGDVAWDCPLVAVAVPSISRGRPGAEAVDILRAGDTYVVEFALWIVRPVPYPADDGTPPSVADVTAAAETILRDGWLLTVGLAGALKTIEGRCTAVWVGTSTSQGPESGLAGWSTPVQVAL